MEDIDIIKKENEMYLFPWNKSMNKSMNKSTNKSMKMRKVIETLHKIDRNRLSFYSNYSGHSVIFGVSTSLFT